MVSKSPLISVVIPTYKRSGMLGRAIDSVLNQTYQNIEVVVIDDNSEGDEYRKETENFMLNYKDDSRVIYVKHRVNRNGSAARNTGVKVSQGEFIALLDDDDEFLPTKLELQISRLNNSNGEYSLCYCHCSYYKNLRKVLERRDSKEGNLMLELLKVEIAFAAGSTLIFRRSAFDKVNGFDESFQRHQDWEFMLRMFNEGYKIACVTEDLVRIHVDDTVNRPNTCKLVETKEKFLSSFKYIIDSYDPDVQDSIYKVHFLEISKSYLLDTNVKEGLNYMKKSRNKNVFDVFVLFLYLIEGQFSINLRYFIRKIQAKLRY